MHGLRHCIHGGTLGAGRPAMRAACNESAAEGDTNVRIAVLTACLIVSSLGAAAAQTRMPELAPGQMSPEQKSMYDAIINGPRHSIEGPFKHVAAQP